MNYIDSFDPDSDDIYKKWVSRNHQQLEEQLVVVDKTLQADLNDAKACLRKANILMHLGQYEEAELLYERALWVNPNIVYAHLGKSVLLRRQSLYADANIACNQAIRLAPKSAFAQIERAMIMFEQNMGVAAKFRDVSASARQQFSEDLKQGLQAIELALQLDRTNALAYAASSYGKWQQGKLAFFGGGKQRQEAIADCNHAIQMDPFLAEAHYAKAIAYLELGLLQDAYNAINSYIELESRNELGYLFKYQLLERMGRKAEAARTLIEATLILS